MSINQMTTIKKIKVYEVEIPLKIPFQISGGTLYNRKSIIVELFDGVNTGYGEAAPFESPFYSEETISTVKMVLVENIIPLIEGKQIKDINHFNKIINNNIRGNNFAKAGIETAYWDLISRKNKISIQELIFQVLSSMNISEKFLNYKNFIDSGVAIGIPESNDLDELKEWVINYLKEGYKRVKIKIKPGWDYQAAAIVREIIGKDFPFWVDANAAYTSNDFQKLKQIDEHKCLFIEQPLYHNDIYEHGKLAKEINTPICLDESLKDAYTAGTIVNLGSSKIWNIKLQRVGGLLEACKIYKIAVENDVQLWGGTMPESGIGASFIIALSSFAGFKYSSDVAPSNRWFKNDQDLVQIEMDKKGQIAVNYEVGIGKISFDNLFKYSRMIY